jgi:hypothetical protein
MPSSHEPLNYTERRGTRSGPCGKACRAKIVTFMQLPACFAATQNFEIEYGSVLLEEGDVNSLTILKLRTRVPRLHVNRLALVSCEDEIGRLTPTSRLLQIEKRTIDGGPG